MPAPEQGRARFGSGALPAILVANAADPGCPPIRPGDTAPLETQFPDMSARSLQASVLVRWFLFAALGISVTGFVAPSTLMYTLAAFVAFAFFAITMLRGAGIYEVLSAGSFRRSSEEERQYERHVRDDLPRYAVLVALYEEAAVVDQILAALDALDYPKDRLQISLIVEEADSETRMALGRHEHGPHIRVVVVPEGVPRTKPRALNYALTSAVGEYVVVYDAEDLPEPDQLRRALWLLARDPDNTACVQARLDIYNAKQSFFTRQFTIEYCALFKAILPALERFGLPVPLGGTSNHFPRHILELAGRWDAFNVTEDADLGIRLARLGYKVKVLSSTTWEEAPPTFAIWIGQRTRWLKGWMQTYLVHMRRPASLWRDLGTFRFLGFQVLMGGMILSALVHPWFYVGLCYSLVIHGGLPFAAHGRPDDWLLPLAAFNLLAGYVSAMLLGALAVSTRRGDAGCDQLAWRVLAMPVYWLLISFAGYRALWQLATSPFDWEKTPHVGCGEQ
ncbi:MAG: glycosyltransferase [Alphaproteobacteria bacterium]|nr:glycosyltransferase [Alphaproteobacteria bacterium]